MAPVDVGLKRAPGQRSEAVDMLADMLVDTVRGAANLAA
jgi:hypothetical protein